MFKTIVAGFSVRQVTAAFLVCILLAIIGYAGREVALDRLNRARAPARRIRAYRLGVELIDQNNSAMLEGMTPEFRKELSAFLNTPAYPLGDDGTSFTG